MPNTPIENHPLIDTEHVYRADHPAYDKSQDTEGGTLILGNGHSVKIMAVFADWNDVPGLDMLGVHVKETGHFTHVTPADLGLDGIMTLTEPEPEPGQPETATLHRLYYVSEDMPVTTEEDRTWSVYDEFYAPDDMDNPVDNLGGVIVSGLSEDVAETVADDLYKRSQR